MLLDVYHEVRRQPTETLCERRKQIIFIPVPDILQRNALLYGHPLERLDWHQIFLDHQQMLLEPYEPTLIFRHGVLHGKITHLND